MPRKSAAALAPTIFDTKRPPPPDGLPPEAAALWTEIVKSVDANYFTAGDLVLVEALVLADHQKRVCDRLTASQGPILDGAINPAAKLSAQLAGVLATLAQKLRLCKSATTRAESATLKKALHGGTQPWDTDPALQHFFS